MQWYERPFRDSLKIIECNLNADLEHNNSSGKIWTPRVCLIGSAKSYKQCIINVMGSTE